MRGFEELLLKSKDLCCKPRSAANVPPLREAVQSQVIYTFHLYSQVPKTDRATMIAKPKTYCRRNTMRGGVSFHQSSRSKITTPG
jgi:hypothetical protein